MDKRHHRWGSAFVLGSLVLAQTPMAWAQPAAAKPSVATPAPAPAGTAKTDLAAAKKSYSDGEKKYKAGDYAGALADFKEANEIKSTPHAERYLGLCEDNLGHYQAAVDWYDKFLAHVPDKLASQGDELRKRETEIKAMPGKLHVESTPTGAAVAVDDRPQSAPTPLDLELAPGSHVVKVTQVGHLPGSKPVEVAYASTQSVTFELDPEPAPAAVAPPPPVAVAPSPAAPIAVAAAPEARSIVPAVVTGALAVAAAGVGTVFGIIALGNKSDFNKNPTTQTADSGDTHALIADMAFGVALTFGVTSAVLLLTKDESATTTSSTHATTTATARALKKTAVTFVPTPMVGAHSGGAGFLLRF